MRNRILGFALLAVSISQPAKAAPVAIVDVPSMVQSADLIVVARVKSPTLDRTANGTFQSYSLLVDRTLKGKPASPVSISVRLDLSKLDAVGVADRQYGIHFLRREGGVYGAANPVMPTLPASPLRSSWNQTSTGPLEGVAQELGGVLATTSLVLTDPTNGVQNLVVGDRTFQAQQVYLDAATALGSIPFASAERTLSAFATGDASTRIWLLFSMLQMGSSAEIEARKSTLLQSLQTELLSPRPEASFSVFLLSNAMEGHLSDQHAVPTLSALLFSRDVTIRRAAASILGDIATPSVIAPLATVALADSDAQVRYLAALGLHDATGEGDAHTTEDFEAHEKEILSFWHLWARANFVRLSHP